MIDNAVNVIASAILDKKGFDVVSLDLRPVGSSIADWFIICSASSTTAVSAIADNILFKMDEQLGRKVARMQGLENGFWVILDYSDVVVHVFLTEYREFYRLENLWSDAPRTEYNEEDSFLHMDESSGKRIKPKAGARLRATARRSAAKARNKIED